MSNIQKKSLKDILIEHSIHSNLSDEELFESISKDVKEHIGHGISKDYYENKFSKNWNSKMVRNQITKAINNEKPYNF